METITLNSTLTAFSGHSGDISKVLEGKHSNAQQLPAPCPNIHKHVSGFPGYGRVLCTCRKSYINK